MFICLLFSIRIEKRRFSVFGLSWQNKSLLSVQFRQPEAFTTDLWITHSDSEYGLLFMIQISDSYMLNATSKEHLESQNGILNGNDGMI